MPGPASTNNVTSTIIKLLVASFLVGLVLSFLDIDPLHLFEHFWETVREVADKVVGFARWSIRYVALGAIVVVPLWLIPTLARSLGRHGRRPADPPPAKPPAAKGDTTGTGGN
jgi:uncharacterized protein DUF6460